MNRRDFIKTLGGLAAASFVPWEPESRDKIMLLHGQAVAFTDKAESTIYGLNKKYWDIVKEDGRVFVGGQTERVQDRIRWSRVNPNVDWDYLQRLENEP